MTQHRTVFFISDRTGITAETLGNALISQFDNVVFDPVPLPYIDNEEKALNAVTLINERGITDNTRPLVFGTVVDATLRETISECQALFIDLFASHIGVLEQELQLKSNHEVGRSHGMPGWESYATRIEAVNFALGNDDGMNVHNYHDADIILVGVSRSGKTPTCLYLALMFGVKAANYPLTEEDLIESTLPAALKAHKNKIVGLTIEAEQLQSIRTERRPNSQYSDLIQCKKEVDRVEHLFKMQKVPYINSTKRSIEEMATQVIVLAEIDRRLR